MNKRITKIFYTFSLLITCFSNSSAQTENHHHLNNHIDSTNYYFNQKNFNKAYTFSIIALNLAEKLRHDSAIYEIRMDQGNIQRTSGLGIEALKTFDLARTSALIINDTNKIVISLLAKGDCFMALYNEEQTLTNYLDSAEKFYNQTEALIIEAKLDNLLADFFEVMGHVEMYKKNYSKSEDWYNKSSDFHLENDDSTTYLITKVNNTNNYIATKRFEEAEKLTLEAANYFKRNNQIGYLYNTYSTLVYLYENKNDFKKAHEYGKLEAKTKDDLISIENTKNLNELNKKYKFVQNKKVIAENEAKADKFKFYLILSSILLITLVIILRLSIHRNRLKQKNLKLLHKEQELLQQSRLEQLESESQHKIINAALDGREEERKAISETLHNSVSALLSSANLHLQAHKKTISSERHQQILKTQDIIMEASVKIRDLSHNLVSSLLINFGLDYAVHDICEKFSSSELEFNLESNLELRYPANIELKVYHIIEELCNNTLKHSQANLAEITLHQSNGHLKISLQDNGIGFDSDKLPKKSAGIGLSQIEARIKNMNGLFDIFSKPEKGTLISLTIPVTPIAED